MSTAAETFADWALGLASTDVPPAVRDAAARHLLDGIGCALAAARTGEAAAAVEVARGLGGPEEATVLGNGLRVGAPAAALANGTLIHALDYDDTHLDGLVHATAAVAPAVLTVGEERDASGSDALTTAVAGYEMVCRLGMAVRHGFHERGFHATSVCGVFAASLISARLMGLDRAQTVNALGIAGSMASGSLEFLNTGSDTKQLHPGWSAHAGIIAARLAAGGASGPASILDGEHGLFRLYAAAPPDLGTLIDDLGARWEVERISVKRYAACQLSHASLDAMRAVGPLDPTTIERITFELPKDASDIVAEPRERKLAPRTPYEAKFSLPWCAAALVIDGGLVVDSFEHGSIARPEVRALAAKVVDRRASGAVPAARVPGRVEVLLTDGTVRVGQADPGSTEPMSQGDVRAKFVANAARDDADALAEAVLGIGGSQRIADLMEELA